MEPTDLGGIDMDGMQKANDIESPIVKDAQSGKFMKRVLNKASGYARPNECVCVLGPSGSGKTSLLNVLSGRINLSRGSKFDGEVISNGRPLTRDHFGEFAAFVQ